MLFRSPGIKSCIICQPEIRSLEPFMVSWKLPYVSLILSATIRLNRQTLLTHYSEKIMTDSDEPPGSTYDVRTCQSYVPLRAYPVFLNSGTSISTESAPDGGDKICCKDRDNIISVHSGTYTLMKEA